MVEKKTATKADSTAEAEKKTLESSSKKEGAAKKAAGAATKAAATKTAAAKTTAAKAEPEKKTAAAKTEPAKATAAAKAEPAKKATSAKAEPAKKVAAAKTTAAAKAEPAKTAAAAKAEPAKKTSAAKAEPTKKTTATKAEPAKKTATAKSESAKTTAAAKAEPAKKTAAAKAEPAKKTAAAKAEPAKKATATKAEPVKKTAAAKAEPAKKTAAAKAEPAKKATATKAEPVKKATASKAEPAKATAAKAEPAKKAAAANAEPAKETKAAKEASKEPAKKAAVKSTAKKAAATKKAVAEKKAPEPKAAKEAAPAQDVPAKAEEAAVEQKQAAAEPQAPATVPADAVAEKPQLEFADVPGVLIAAAECAPFVKVGGLADVVGALPKYLKKIGVDARVIMPFHRQIKERFGNETQHMCDYQASLGWRSQYVGLEKLEYDGVTYYFIDNEFYFGGPIYCGGEFEGEQYAFFTRAVMDIIPQLDYDVKILHCNDWHTAMMPLLARTQYHGGMQEGLRTLLTIHNLHFQGQFSHEFDRDLLRVDDSLATPQFVEHYGCDNMLKAGIVFSNKVNTVSPTYAREICEPYLGESLDGVLRSRGSDLWGILNGIDTDAWNPQTDEFIPAHFSVDDLSGKRKVRDALLEELGLEPAGENTAVISMVGRLTPQKGIDLVNWAVNEIMNEDVRFIILGSGYSEFEGYLRDAEQRHKGRLCSYIGYNAELSHRIYAGSDLFLMPSLYEPCGISQMIAMRYGTLPIVRETGGLRDTVIPYNEYTGEGNGFSFANYDVGEMLDIIRYALWVWRGEPARARLIKQAMESDFSFDRCARTYAELYRAL